MTPEQIEAWRREDREAARLRRRVLYWLIAFWAIVIQMIFPPAPRLVWNASASAPVGLYWVRLGARIGPGDMVIARTPIAVRRLAAERHYLPENVPLVKRVAAAVGSRVCARGDAIWVDGRRAVTRRVVDGRGRFMPWWSGCRTLAADDYLLLMTQMPDSFDGRYFGVTKATDIIGKAQPLWTR